MRAYVVREGDYLTKLAATMRFDADEVWRHPKNQELREARDPDILNPGDVLYLPEVPPAPLRLKRGATNVYTAKVETVSVTVVLREGDDAHAGQTYVVEGLPTVVRGETGTDGRVTFDVPVTITEVRLILLARHVAYRIRIGHLDPVETTSGLRARLTNLGHYVDAASLRGVDGLPFDTALGEAMLSCALKSFQKAQGFPTTGEPDARTVAALVAAHGS